MSHDVSYTFIYSDAGAECPGFPTTKNIEYTVSFDDSEQWTAVADEFFNFLSSIYGYHCDPKKYAARFETKRSDPWEDE